MKATVGLTVQVKQGQVSASTITILGAKRYYQRGTVREIGGSRKEPRVAVEWDDEGRLFWFDAAQLEAIISL